MNYESLVSAENLFASYDEFKRGKRGKEDVMKFERNLEENIFNLISQRVGDPNILELTLKIISSYENSPGTGIPLGNVTSQLFANIYLNELDQFIKHKLQIKYYFRYADDFVLLHHNESLLKLLIPQIKAFLKNHLQVDLHPQKISIRKIRQGVDFLGYVCAPHFRVVRTTSKKRMFRNIKERLQEALAGNRTAKSFHQTIQSYMGIMIHANSAKLMKKMNIPLLLSITENDI